MAKLLLDLQLREPKCGRRLEGVRFDSRCRESTEAENLKKWFERLEKQVWEVVLARFLMIPRGYAAKGHTIQRFGDE